jgi:hypothetical protein
LKACKARKRFLCAAEKGADLRCRTTRRFVFNCEIFSPLLIAQNQRNGGPTFQDYKSRKR